MQRFLLYVRTLRYLKARQLSYFVARRLFPARSPKTAPEKIGVRVGTAMGDTGDVKPEPSIDEFEFKFLNRTKSFETGNIDWVCKTMPKLWRYNLHYFDYIHDSRLSFDTTSELISDWIARNPVGNADAWEPYTVSLRIVNWIRRFLKPDIRSSVPSHWLSSLYQQTQWLEQNIEYHILANHYLKNGKALFFAGMYFNGAEADGWLRLGSAILRKEADEQILEDGGHYERSPMYHSIILWDYLDALNLIRSSADFFDPELNEYLEIKTRLALEFLHDICLPDGRIPLFNDSAFGIAAEPIDIWRYAYNLMNYVPSRSVNGLNTIQKAASGYFVMHHMSDKMVLDCGIIGPDYQPGHAHCDTLSYELALDGKTVFVDSGVHDYENSPTRRYARSTAAHNTVVVDGMEQSEVWGTFRVARRAAPITAKLEKLSESQCRFEGSHDGYRRLGGGVVHTRTVDYDASLGWSVCDHVSGGGTHQVQSHIHIHPDFRATLQDATVTIIDKLGGRIATICISAPVSIDITKGKYFPEFGIAQDKDVVTLSVTGTLPQFISYVIKKSI